MGYTGRGLSLFYGEWSGGIQQAKLGQKQAQDDYRGKRTLSFWQVVVNQGRPDLYEAYLRLWPSGIYSGTARGKLEAFNGESSNTSANSKVPLAQSATKIDSLVGIWKRPMASGHEEFFCHLIVGQSEDGTLRGVAIEYQHEKNRERRRFFTIEGKGRSAYNWSFPYAGYKYPWLHPFGQSGAFTLDDETAVSVNLVSDDLLCYQTMRYMAEPRPSSSRFRKLSLHQANAFELSGGIRWQIESGDFPSPFQPGTQWGIESSTLASGTTGASGAPSETADDRDR